MGAQKVRIQYASHPWAAMGFHPRQEFICEGFCDAQINVAHGDGASSRVQVKVSRTPTNLQKVLSQSHTLQLV